MLVSVQVWHLSWILYAGMCNTVIFIINIKCWNVQSSDIYADVCNVVTFIMDTISWSV